MGIRASYWLTGGIMTVLGLAVTKVLMTFPGGIALAVGAFLGPLLLKALLVVGAALVAGLVIGLVRRPGRQREPVT